MPRTLPWLRDTGASSSSSRTPRSKTSAPQHSTASQKRIRQDTSDDDELNTTGVATPQRRARLRAGRSPSSSPIRPPPKQEPMREGWAADDVWMMVEDEFLSTAQLFTSHLHHAEYKRLNALAKQRAQAEPPSAGTGLAGFVPHHRTATNGAKIQRRGSDASDDGVPWVGNPMLAGLMDSPRKAPPVLKRTIARTTLDNSQGKPAGYSTAEDVPDSPSRSAKSAVSKAKVQYSGDDDDDDLDLNIGIKERIAKLKANMKVKREHQSKAAEGRIQKAARQDLHDDLDIMKRAPAPSHKLVSTKHLTDENDAASKETESAETRFDAPLQSNDKLAAVLARRKERLESKKRREEAPRINDMTVEIPTFMI